MGWRDGLQIKLSQAERKRLEQLLSGGIQSVRTVIRELVLRQMDRGSSAVEAGAGVGIWAKVAWEIGKRYLEGGMERAMYDAPRPGQKPLLDAEHGQRIIAMVCGPPPVGRARWTVRLIAEEAVKRKMVEHVGPETVRILLQRHDLKPGRHSLKSTPTRSAEEFADYLRQVAHRYPDARTIHLVMDNLNTHHRETLTERYGEEVGDTLWDRFTVHYTPKHGSWLNQAEIEISLLSRQCLGRRRVPDLATLRREAMAWVRRLNRSRTTIEWRFTRKQARRKLHYSITQARY